MFALAASLASLWAFYFQCVGVKRAVMAANADVLLVAMSSLIVISYVRDWRLLLVDLVGTWLGTYYAVRR